MDLLDFEKKEVHMINLLNLFILSFAFSTSAFAYLHNQTNSGVNIHWPNSTTVVDVYVNSQNTLGLDEATIQNIGLASANQWNGLSRIALRKNSTLGKNQPNLNEIYFSTDPTFFGGTAVKGVTQVSYKQDTGDILEADVLIDDSSSVFTLVQSDVNYLGNVVTHELGHLLGLGHGQVLGSTMFYELSLGQSQLNEDDKAGIYSTYPIASTTQKTITGQVIGGKNLIAVFGAQVQAISASTGRVAAAGVSDASGRFSIDGLATGDQYFLYTEPLIPIGLPANYANIKSDFCESSKSYRGSFFQSCGATGEGYPQAISLSNANVDVGQITIRCGLDVPPAYIQQKGITAPGYSLTTIENGRLGNTFVGYFSSQELTRTLITPDQFKINLTGITTPNWSTAYPVATPLYLEIKILNQILFSPFKTSVHITGPTTNLNSVVSNPLDGFLNLDTVTRIPINLSNPIANDFTVQITPSLISTNITNYFPSISTFQDSMYFYLAVVSLVTSADGGITYTTVSSRNYQVSDNYRCPDATNTYTISGFNTRGVASVPANNQKKAVACGSIDENNNNGSGPKGFMIGLLLCSLVTLIIGRFRQRLL
jgi:hypothetical protein